MWDKLSPWRTRHPGQDESYRQSVAEYGTALERLAFAYESDSDLRLDLLQEIHLALWRSFEKCSPMVAPVDSTPVRKGELQTALDIASADFLDIARMYDFRGCNSQLNLLVKKTL